MQMQDARVSDLQLDIPKSYQGAGTFMQIYPCKYGRCWANTFASSTACREQPANAIFGFSTIPLFAQ